MNEYASASDEFQGATEAAGDIPCQDIVIDLCAGGYFLWDASQVVSLRRHHRIVGIPVGCLSWKPRQNVHLGLPVQLTKYDVAYLLRNYIARIRDSGTFDRVLYSDEERERLKKDRELQREIQIELLKEQKANELDTLSPVIMHGKKAKRATNEQHKSEDDNTEYESFKVAELQKTKDLGNEHLWIEMPMKSRFADTLPTLVHEVPFTNEERLKYSVFCDLHDQGFYVANGSKFGGDFLVYPGDPVCYHSFYIVLCVPCDKKLSVYEYSALGRLASTVKKTLLLCFELEGCVEYLSVSWTGVVP